MLSKKLADEARFGRSDGETDGDLASAAKASCDQHVRYVRAGHQQDERDDDEENPEYGHAVAHHFGVVEHGAWRERNDGAHGRGVRGHGLMAEHLHFGKHGGIGGAWFLTGEYFDEAGVSVIDERFTGAGDCLHGDGKPDVGFEDERAVEARVRNTDDSKRSAVQRDDAADDIGTMEIVLPGFVGEHGNGSRTRRSGLLAREEAARGRVRTHEREQIVAYELCVEARGRERRGESDFGDAG